MANQWGKDVQRRLKQTAALLNRGDMDPGIIDGIVGRQTFDAIAAVCTYAEGRGPVQPISVGPDPTLLLAFIRAHEADGAVDKQGVATAYDVVWGGISKADRPQNKLKKHLTEMTVQEVLDWQDSIDAKYMSEASGAYQIMEDTLRPLGHRAELYSAELQDELALRLMAWDELQANPDKLALRLARTWASIPVLRPMQGAHKKLVRGESYYAGDGLNSADPQTAAELEAVLAATLTSRA